MDDRLWEDGSTSVFRPSYSATSLNCAGSLIPSMRAADTAGYDAAVGTVFHEVIAEWQLKGRPDHWLGDHRTIVNGDQTFDVEIDEEMFVHAEECLRRVADIPGDRYVETRVDISSLTPIPNQGGTCDLAICQIGLLDIRDWKYGRGVQVFALKNTQLLCYAWGFFQEFDYIYNFQKIRLWIAQPRLFHFDLWEITRDELLEFAEYARGRWALAWTPNADRTPSPKACQWCKVRLVCSALEAVRQSLADATFDVLDVLTVSHETQKSLALVAPPDPQLEPPVNLATAQIARILQWRRVMESWFKDCAEELVTRGLQGDDLAGLWKVSQGRSRRRWIDEEAAVDGLVRVGVDEADCYERAVVSPNQSEKLLRAAGVRGKLTKAYLNTLVDRPPGKPTLVPIGDNRASLGSIVDDSFEGEE
jgi:Casjensviridae exonuclease